MCSSDPFSTPVFRTQRRTLVGFLALAATLAGVHTAFSEPQTAERLLRLDPGRAIFLNPPYERLCTENLFVTPGVVGRYLFVPNFKDPEILVSLYRSSDRAAGLPGNYWLTLTRPVRRIAQSYDNAGNWSAKAIKIERRDAPIPEATAQAIHQLWLAMLQQARKRTRLDMEIDSDAMFFYTTDAAGKTLRGERFGTGANVLALADIGGLLITYGYASLPERAALAHTIEEKAVTLYKRIH